MHDENDEKMIEMSLGAGERQVSSGAGVYDTEGNSADDTTLVGDIDGRRSTLGGLKVYITSDVYTKEETDAAIDSLAAHYITDSNGNPFDTVQDLVDATLVGELYSGGVKRTPIRNDYTVVLNAGESANQEWRYIYAVPDDDSDSDDSGDAPQGEWQPQYPIETNDYEALSNKPQIGGVALSGNMSAATLGLATTADVSQQIAGKLDSVSAAQDFDASQFYPENTYVTYEGKLYQFTSDHEAGVTWANSSSIVVFKRIMDADATFDIINGLLTIKNAQGVIVWQESASAPNLDYVMRVDPETGGIYYTTPDTNA